MPNNTYERDTGEKYNFIKKRVDKEEDADSVFAGSITDDEEYQTFDTDDTGDGVEPDAGGRDLHNGEASDADKGFSVLSDSERKYSWEKVSSESGGGINAEDGPSYKKARKQARLESQADDDENYDLEIGNNGAGLKILMGLMLIIFIVIISILIYKLSILNDQYQEALTKLDAAPTLQQLNDAKSDALAKDQTIKQLTDELSGYRADNATAGELVETPQGSVYIVAANDTLGKIAQVYQVSINQIMEWNNLDNADNIKVGQKLIVRKANDTTTTSTTQAGAN